MCIPLVTRVCKLHFDSFQLKLIFGAIILISKEKTTFIVPARRLDLVEGGGSEIRGSSLKSFLRPPNSKLLERTWLIKLFEFGSTKSQRQINTANHDVRNEIKTISAFLPSQKPISLFPTAHSIFPSSWLNIFFVKKTIMKWLCPRIGSKFWHAQRYNLISRTILCGYDHYAE